MIASKYVDAPCPRASTTSRYGARCAHSSANSSSEISTPQTDRRSRHRCRCGDVKSPGVTPWAHAISAAARAIVVFPFVPVTWIVG